MTKKQMAFFVFCLVSLYFSGIGVGLTIALAVLGC